MFGEHAGDAGVGEDVDVAEIHVGGGEGEVAVGKVGGRCDIYNNIVVLKI